MSHVDPSISRDTLIRIVEAATLAPSAENLQPWIFEIAEDSVTVCLDLRRTLASDIHQLVSLTSIGTCIENAVTAATGEGFEAAVELVNSSFDYPADKDYIPIANLRFTEGDQRDVLANYIAARGTVRRMDPHLQVDEDLIDQLSESCRRFSEVSIRWVDRDKLPEFAALVGIGNRIRLEHKPFHAELFRSLRFTELEVRSTRDGLDVQTLQLPVGVPALVSKLRQWDRMKLANLFGFSRSIAKQAQNEVLQSGAVGFLIVPNADPQTLVTGGRALERIWLKATQLELSFHPVASLPVFLRYVVSGCETLSVKHQTLVKDMARRFDQLYPEPTSQVMQIAFRIGYPAKRSRTLRRRVSDVIVIQ